MIRRTTTLGLCFFGVACGVETIVHGIDEKQANQIIVLLSDSNMSANKTMISDGRTVNYNVSVSNRNKEESLRLLNLHDYPKKIIAGYGEGVCATVKLTTRTSPSGVVS